MLFPCWKMLETWRDSSGLSVSRTEVLIPFLLLKRTYLLSESPQFDTIELLRAFSNNVITFLERVSYLHSPYISMVMWPDSWSSRVNGQNTWVFGRGDEVLIWLVGFPLEHTQPRPSVTASCTHECVNPCTSIQHWTSQELGLVPGPPPGSSIHQPSNHQVQSKTCNQQSRFWWGSKWWTKTGGDPIRPEAYRYPKTTRPGLIQTWDQRLEERVWARSKADVLISE